MDRRRALAGLAALAAGMLPGRSRAMTAERMLTRPIPGTKEVLPVIGLGTWQTFDVDAGAATPLREVLRAFAAAGGRVVDSSPMYGRAESVTGVLTTELDLNAGLFLASKVWTRGREAGERELARTLARMGRERLDLLQVHNLLDAETHLRTLAEWQAAGRVRYIGITHWSESAYPAVERLLARDERIDFLQINYSVAERAAAQRILPLAAERGVAVLVNRPFAEGALFRQVRGRALPAWAADIGCTAWSQLFLKYIVAHPAVTCVIPATSNPAHLRENVLAGTGTLPDAAMRRRIEQAL